jgi:hypothetical protein
VLNAFYREQLPTVTLSGHPCPQECQEALPSASGGASTGTSGCAAPAGAFFDAVPGHTISGWPMTGNYVDLNDYPPGASVTVEVRDASGGLVIDQASGVIGPDGYARLVLSVDLEAGHHVTVIDVATGTSRETTVALFDYTLLSQADDVVEGVAPPGAAVTVFMLDDPAADSIHGNTVLAQFTVTADGSGVWTLNTAGAFDIADDGASGPGSGFQTDMVAARTPDCDGDTTLLFCPFC